MLPKFAVVAFAAVASFASAAFAAGIDTSASQAILIDTSTDTVLLEKNADERMPTSSMSKVMTMYMVFERLKQGRLSLDDALLVSEKAWRMQGSKMYVELGNQIRVEDLIRGVIVQSGNDATIVLAEGLSGSEQAFAAEMTKRARDIGMTASNFVNASGWPDDAHYSTARDLAILADRLIENFPEYYHYYSEKEFTYHDIKQGNRNPLLYRNMGADGVKTGHTEAAGYGLMGSAVRDGRRLILVVNGLPDMQARADESARLLEWGFREFGKYDLAEAGQALGEADVWYGAADTVSLVPARRVSVTIPHSSRANLEAKIVVDQPIKAPIAKGTRLGKLVLNAPDMAVPVEVPLVAGEDVAEAGLGGRLLQNIMHLALGSAR